MNIKRSFSILFLTLSGTLSNVVSKARLIGVVTKGEEETLAAKSESLTAENFGRL